MMAATKEATPRTPYGIRKPSKRLQVVLVVIEYTLHFHRLAVTPFCHSRRRQRSRGLIRYTMEPRPESFPTSTDYQIALKSHGRLLLIKKYIDVRCCA